MKLKVHYDPVGRRRWFEFGSLAIGRHVSRGIDRICFGGILWGRAR